MPVECTDVATPPEFDPAGAFVPIEWRGLGNKRRPFRGVRLMPADADFGHALAARHYGRLTHWRVAGTTEWNVAPAYDPLMDQFFERDQIPQPHCRRRPVKVAIAAPATTSPAETYVPGLGWMTPAADDAPTAVLVSGHGWLIAA